MANPLYGCFLDLDPENLKMGNMGVMVCMMCCNNFSIIRLSWITNNSANRAHLVTDGH